jgi:hypothetical protein
MKQRKVHKNAQQSAHVRPRFRPMLEVLEARLVMANCVWTGAFGNGSWFNSFNWSNQMVPGTGDTAAFTQAGPNCTISGANATVGALVIQGWGGTLTISDGSTLIVCGGPANGPSDIVDSTITGTGSSTLIFASGTAVSLLGGTINPTSTQFNGTTNLCGGGPVMLGGTIGNSGAFTVQSGEVFLQPDSVFSNYSSFLMTNQGIAMTATGGIANGQEFINASGAVIAQAGGTVTLDVAFDNCAFVNIQNGTLNFGATAVQNAGTLDIEPGATLGTTSTFQLNGGALFSGSSQLFGNLNVVGGAVYPGVLDTVPYGTLRISGTYQQGPNGLLGVSIFLNSNGSVRQYTSLSVTNLICAGALAVGTGPYRVTPQKTDVANVITYLSCSPDFFVSGAITGISPMLKWVHNTTNPPANTYQLKIGQGGALPVTGSTQPGGSGVNITPAEQTITQKVWQVMNSLAIDTLMLKTSVISPLQLERSVAALRIRKIQSMLENALGDPAS